jgi:uncharacterized membrane-anchored protein
MKTIDQIIQAAKDEGVLPAGAVLPEQDQRPWPVVALTALGAWLAAWPLLAVVYLLLGDLIHKGAGPYLVGALILAGAVVILRSRDIPLFIEQLAIPAALVGGGTLAMGLFRDLPMQGAAVALTLVVSAVAWVTPRTWLRALLGALACGLIVTASVPELRGQPEHQPIERFWLAWHFSFGIWLLGQWAIDDQLNSGKTASAAAALKAFSSGWVLATLAGLALWSGMTFLVAANFGAGPGLTDAAMLEPTWSNMATRIVSVLLALGAGLWLARCWPALRQPWCAAAALVVAGLAWQMPALGATLSIVAVCLGTGRLKTAAAGALAAAWIIGSFYYQLHLPLAEKAVHLIGSGALLGALAWFGAGRNWRHGQQRAAARSISSGSTWIAVAALLVLAVANGAIWQKENLIAEGKPIFVALAPVDPRSLMQGDFMRLNFRLPSTELEALGRLPDADRPHVVASSDARGVATVLRVHKDEPLGPNELLIELTPHERGWMLVSDAWYFHEGQAKRWQDAKYGEFRVAPDGRALLVGLRGANLEQL